MRPLWLGSRCAAGCVAHAAGGAAVARLRASGLRLLGASLGVSSSPSLAGLCRSLSRRASLGLVCRGALQLLLAQLRSLLLHGRLWPQLLLLHGQRQLTSICLAGPRLLLRSASCLGIIRWQLWVVLLPLRLLLLLLVLLLLFSFFLLVLHLLLLSLLLLLCLTCVRLGWLLHQCLRHPWLLLQRWLCGGLRLRGRLQLCGWLRLQ
jgi:hypothetical protein